MSETNLQRSGTVRTTVSLPAHLVEWSQQFIEKGIVPSRNALIVAALESFLNDLERQEIDQEFAAMADDQAYQDLSVQLAEEFAESDWETIGLTEEGSA